MGGNGDLTVAHVFSKRYPTYSNSKSKVSWERLDGRGREGSQRLSEWVARLMVWMFHMSKKLQALSEFRSENLKLQSLSKHWSENRHMSCLKKNLNCLKLHMSFRWMYIHLKTVSAFPVPTRWSKRVWVTILFKRTLYLKWILNRCLTRSLIVTEWSNAVYVTICTSILTRSDTWDQTYACSEDKEGFLSIDWVI